VFGFKGNNSEKKLISLNESRSSKVTSISKYKLAINIALLFIILISTLRYDVGTDYLGYVDMYNDYGVFNKKIFTIFNEFGFYLIVITGIWIGFSSIWLFFVFSALSWSLLLKTFKPHLSLLFLIFLILDERLFWSFSGIRQWLAIAFFVLSIVKYGNKKYKYFLLYIFMGSLFHTSILFLTPVVLLLDFIPLKFLNKKIVLLLFFTTLYIGASDELNNLIQNIFLGFAKFIPELSYYTRHIELGRIVNSTELESIPGIGFWLKRILDLILIIKIFKHKKELSKIWIYLLILGVLYFNLFYSVEILLRLSLYPLIFRSLLWARIYQLEKNNYMLVFVFIIYLTIFIAAFINGSNQCCPYNFI